MSNTTNMIEALAAAVLGSVSNEMLLNEAAGRGLAEASALTNEALLKELDKRGLKKSAELTTAHVMEYLARLDAYELNRALTDVDGARLAEALGEDEGLWEMIDDKDRIVGDWLEANASDFVDRLDTQDLLEELGNRCRR